MVGSGVTLLSILLAAILASCGQAPTGLPQAASWHQQDIGDVGVPGYMEQSTGATLVVHGAGTDIGGPSDSFHLSYQMVTGDTTISTHVVSFSQHSENAKVGVMVRATADPASPFALVYLGSLGGTHMRDRTASGADASEAGSDTNATAPTWIRLSRVGDTFTGYESADGKSWTELGSTTISMPAAVMVGLAVSSASTTTLTSATFDSTQVDGSGPADPAAGPMQTVDYKVDSSNFPNPERGWYIPTSTNYGSVYSAGDTLAMYYVRLDSYRSQALPSSFLDGLKSNFASARSAGVKLVLRFTYNFGYDPDAPLNIVLQQITQLKPILTQYSDVIAVMQAGFIGAWGEWHDSTNNLTTLTNRSKIANAILDALPTTRMIEIRTPYRANDIFPTPPDQSTAFDGSKASRVGQHNDCFVSTSNDGGTYQTTADRTYAQQVTKYTAMGGETCDLGGLSSLNDCPASLQQLQTYHWDYLNQRYWTNIYDKWKSQGCYDEVTKRLGYRFSLDSVTAPTSLSPGTPLGMSIKMDNTGFGKLYNPRPMELVFVPTAGGSKVTVTVSSDVRRLVPGPGDTKTIDVGAALPSGMASGTYDVYLNLADASSNLNTDPRYSIRLANQGTWDAGTGYNDLNLQVTVN